MTLTALLEMIGQIAIAVVLIALGLLSRRLGAATHAKAQYAWFFLAGGLVIVGCIIRLLNVFFGWASPDLLHESLEWVLIYTGLPAAGVTIGVIMSWHYWSWLLAERD